MISQLEKQGKEFRKLFLLEFTRELIKNTRGDEIFKLKKILEEENSRKGYKLDRSARQKINFEKEIENKNFEELIPYFIQKKPEEIIEQKIPKKSEIKTIEEPKRKFEKSLKTFPNRIIQNKKIIRNSIPQRINSPRRKDVLRVPEPISPRELEYLRRMPGREKSIELGKLNPLIADPMIKVIECAGSDKNIIIKGDIGIKKANIILNEEEIKEIMRKFSEVSKIPLQEGIFKVVYGNLILSAVISDIVGTKFILRKMTPVIPAPRF